MSSNRIDYLNYDQLVLEKNPRSPDQIPQSSILEMADSIMEHGIKEPLKGRPREDGKIGIWDGQRRYLGFGAALSAVQAGREATGNVETLPVIVAEITDQEMLLNQLLTFVQRQGLSFRDEVSALQRIRSETGMQVKQIAKYLSKTEDYVSIRVNLVNVPDRLWTAFEEGLVKQEHLELASQIDLETDREEFAFLVLGGRFSERVLDENEARALKESAFVISLHGCGFEPDDEGLVQIKWAKGVRIGGGKCPGCPRLIMHGKNPMCHNVKCYDEKQEEHWKNIRSNLTDNGQRWMDVAETGQHFEGAPNPKTRRWELKRTSKLVNVAASLRFEDTGSPDESEQPVWEDLLKGTSVKKEWITARHQEASRKRLYHLLERERAIELAIEADAANAALFVNRPQPKEATPKKEEKPAEPAQSSTTVTTVTTTTVVDEVEDDEDEAAADGESASSVTQTHEENLQFRVDDLEPFWKAATEGGEIDHLLRLSLRKLCEVQSLDSLRAILAVVSPFGLEKTREWARDAVIRAICENEECCDLLMFVSTLAMFQQRGDSEVIGALQAMHKVDPKIEEKAVMMSERVGFVTGSSEAVKVWGEKNVLVPFAPPEAVVEEPEIEDEDPEAELEAHDQEQAKPDTEELKEQAKALWKEGHGKRVIATKLGMSENTARNWIKAWSKEEPSPKKTPKRRSKWKA